MSTSFTECRTARAAALICFLIPVVATEARAECSDSYGPGRRYAQFYDRHGLSYDLEQAQISCKQLGATARCAVVEIAIFEQPRAAGSSNLVWGSGAEQASPHESKRALFLELRRGADGALAIQSGLEMRLDRRELDPRELGKRPMAFGHGGGVVGEARSPGAERSSPEGSVRIDAVEGRGAAFTVRGQVAVCLDAGEVRGRFVAVPPPTSPYGVTEFVLRAEGEGPATRILVSDKLGPGSTIGLGGVGSGTRR
jgi:hypothetical protein